MKTHEAGPGTFLVPLAIGLEKIKINLYYYPNTLNKGGKL